MVDQLACLCLWAMHMLAWVPRGSVGDDHGITPSSIAVTCAGLFGAVIVSELRQI